MNDENESKGEMMKLIDLLNKIANGEEVPKKIKYNGEIFTLRDEKDDYANAEDWFTDRFCFLELNEEVEILEEEKKIPEEVEIDFMNEDDTLEDITYMTTINVGRLADKINSIIDYLKSKGE